MNIYNASQPMPPLVSNVSESLKRQRDIDELIHTLRYGPMPDFLTNPKSWYFETEQRIIAILKKKGVHKSEAYRMAHGLVQQAEKDRCFDFYAIVDKAIMEHEQRQRDLQDEKDKKAMAVKQNPQAPKQVAPGTFANAQEKAKASNLQAELTRVNEAMRLEQNRRGMGHLDGTIFWNNKLAEKFGIGPETVNIRAAIIGLPNYSFDAIMAAWVSILEADPGYVPPKAMNCPDCHGTGLRDCRGCKGTGHLRDDNGHDLKCLSCNGEGTENCNHCKGTGRLNIDKSNLAASVSPDEPKTDSLDEWFPRDKAEEPKTEPEHWSKSDAKRGAFWAGVRGWMNKYEDMRTMEAQRRIDYTHTALGCEHLDQTPLSLDEAIARVKSFIDDDHKLTNHTPISHDEPVTSPVEPTSPVGVYSPDPKSTLRPVEAPPLNEGKNHHMEAPVIAYTTIIINDHRVNVTAREGATAEQVHDTVIALINGLRLIAADDTIKSYAAVIDNRDKTIRMKGEVKAAEPAPATTPAPAVNGSNGHATDGGTVGCAMIEVGTARKTGNPQLNFACDGMNFPIHYSLPVGDMVNLLSKVKQASGQPFTAADLTPNRKFGGAWRVVWEPSKSDPKYKNVVEVLPA